MERDDRSVARWDALARRLLGEPTLTSADVAASAGVSADATKRFWRAIGLPPVADEARVFTSADAEIMRGVRALLTKPQVDVETAVQVTRVIGRAMAQIADAVVAGTNERSGPIDEATMPPTDAETGVALVPMLEPLLLHVWRHHLMAAVARATSTSAAESDPVQVVGFADLVGFTALARRVGPTALTAVLDRFEALAYERIVERGGRVIKMIGDEVMFVVDTPAAGAEIALGLAVACAEDATLPDARGGIAIGPTRSWEGDYFGPTVNLASRLVAVARPGTVLASDDLGRYLDGRAFALRHLRPQPLQGIGRVRVWVVARPPEPARQSRR